MRHHEKTTSGRDDLLLDEQRRREQEEKSRPRGRDSNPDPITGAPGAHPVGTGVGAAGGAVAGAAVGAIGGPLGAGIGGAIGAVAGGLAGKAVAEKIDPTVETAYWRESYRSRPYVGSDETFETYEPAYRYGWESQTRHPDARFEDVESDLGRNWDRARGSSTLGWDRAKLATRDAWHRVERRIPGDADHDGR